MQKFNKEKELDVFIKNSNINLKDAIHVAKGFYHGVEKCHEYDLQRSIEFLDKNLPNTQQTNDFIQKFKMYVE